MKEMTSLKNKLFIDVALTGEKEGLDGLVLWDKYYKNEPSLRCEVTGVNYEKQMEAKYLRVYASCMSEIYNRGRKC